MGDTRSAFFVCDEIPAVLESTFGQLDASRVHQPILVAEGADSAHLGPLSQQITAHARRLLPHAEVATVEGTNHMMPLQGPETVARLIELRQSALLVGVAARSEG